MNESLSLKIPSPLLDKIKSANTLFLTVNPVLAFPDVLLGIEKLVSTETNLVDVVALDRLELLCEANSSPVLIACGDLPLKDLPGYLRGLIYNDGLNETIDYILSNNWLALRVRMSSADQPFYEYMDSASFSQLDNSLADSSLVNTASLSNHIKEANEKETIHKADHIPIPHLKASGSDLEFID